MNSIIWKGVSSTTINGLLICELPPITKPKMRIKETVIDGKDGSIIEELGYEPYDKTVVIGLYGNYDIDKIIKYFTGEGDIIFSNEPNKIYRAKICGKVDYIRLLRFRQASITFRVQPYKYKFNEFYRETQTATASGTSIAVNDSADANLKALKIYGKSTQEKTTGKNKIVYPYVYANKTADGVTYTDLGDGGVSVNGTAISGGAYYMLNGGFATQKTPIPSWLVVGNSYTISGQKDNVLVELYLYTEDGTGKKFSGTFTMPSGYVYYGIFLYVGLNSTANTTVYPMIRPASVTDDTYEKYTGGIPSPNPDYPQEIVSVGDSGSFDVKVNEQKISLETPLMAIPVTDKSLATYTDASGQMWCADEIDLEKCVYVQRIGRWVIDGSKEPTTFVDGNKGGKVCGYTYADVMSGISNKRLPKMCNRLKPPTTTQPTTYKDCEIGCWSFNTASGDTPDIFLIFNLGEFATPSEVETYLVEHPLTFIGILETPIETPLSAKQIAMCKALKSNEPTTNISNDGNAYMTVEYIKPFEVFNEGLEDSKPLMILKGSGTVEISVNGMHTFTYTFPEGENEVYIDSEKEDAYLENVLKNRNMNGEFPILIPRTNKIEWSGDVESISVLPRSRWL